MVEAQREVFKMEDLVFVNRWCMFTPAGYISVLYCVIHHTKLNQTSLFYRTIIRLCQFCRFCCSNLGVEGNLGIRTWSETFILQTVASVLGSTTAPLLLFGGQSVEINVRKSEAEGYGRVMGHQVSEALIHIIGCSLHYPAHQSVRLHKPLLTLLSFESQFSETLKVSSFSCLIYHSSLIHFSTDEIRVGMHDAIIIPFHKRP